MALTSYNDQRETHRSAYKPGFERLYQIRRHIHLYILPLIPMCVALPALWWLWLAAILFLLAVDTDTSLRMQDPFGRGKGPYLKKNARSESGQIEEWSAISTPEHRGGDGIWPLGNNMYTREEVWASDDYVRTHAVLSGTTGSGKTVTMCSTFIYVAMVANSGVVMIDGKADPKTWFDLYAAAVATDRTDDLLVLNFVVGATQPAEFSFMAEAEKELWEEFQAVESNTFNAFGTGTADTLFEIGSALLGADATGDNKMWVERAEALLRSMLKALVEKRDQGQLKISIATIQQYMSLERLSELESDTSISESARHQVGAVLNEIAGYRDAMRVEDPQKRAQLLADQPSKQFTFLHMQFGALFAMLVGTYGHIANVEYSDIWTPDVISNRRILLVMLPALEKAPTSLAQLGRMATSAIKSALSQSISGSLTGRKADLVDRRPTNSLRAMVLIYDEAASYIQSGTADVASQSRSLGAFNIFSSQEWASFKNAGEIEATRIISNTGLKIVLKNEDQETAKQFGDALGDTPVLRTGGKRTENGKLVETERRLEMVPRVTFQQMMNLAEGQAFLKWRDTLLHIRMPFVQVPPVTRAQRNDMVPMPGAMASDRVRYRQRKNYSDSITSSALPPLNLIGTLMGMSENADEELKKELMLFEKLTRAAHSHQVVIPWEEKAPPLGNIQHAMIMHTDADLLAGNMMWALKKSQNDSILKGLIELPLGTDTRFEIPFLPHEEGLANPNTHHKVDNSAAEEIDARHNEEMDSLLHQLNSTVMTDSRECSAISEKTDLGDDELIPAISTDSNAINAVDDDNSLGLGWNDEPFDKPEVAPESPAKNVAASAAFSTFLRTEQDDLDTDDLDALQHSHQAPHSPLPAQDESNDPMLRALAATGYSPSQPAYVAEDEDIDGLDDDIEAFEYDISTTGTKRSETETEVRKNQGESVLSQMKPKEPITPRRPFSTDEE